MASIADLDSQTLLKQYNLHREEEDGTPRLSYNIRQHNPYRSFSYDLESDEFEELAAMYSRGASRDEIPLWPHEKAEAFLDEDDERVSRHFDKN
jgi:hypothetical protein